MWVFGLHALHRFVWGWVVAGLGLRRLSARLRGQSYAPYSGPLAARLFCEDMGPTFLKLAQLVASSEGMFPERYSLEFKKCLDQVKPFSFAEVETLLVDELGTERLAQLHDVESTPVASASIAQVHLARLGDEDVVIKVQRPGLEARVNADMRILKLAARIAERIIPEAALANPVAIVADFEHTLREELDFRQEAENLDFFNHIQRELGNRSVRAPRPHWDYTTRRVLVMERFWGARIDDPALQERALDAEAKLLDGVRAWFQCVVLYGFFHGDVHAGNLMLLDDDDIGFIDFGIVGRFTEEQRLRVTDYLVALALRDYRSLGRIMAEMSGRSQIGGDGAFLRDVEATYKPILAATMREFSTSSMLEAMHHLAVTHHLRMPRDFVLITKQLLYFDRYAKMLAPDINIFTDMRLIASLMQDIQTARSKRVAQPAAAANLSPA
jgi:predicted unusual protein kinase regulating ubiquinone biosynthesis (AarF/ABC1/UbiB family)